MANPYEEIKKQEQELASEEVTASESGSKRESVKAAFVSLGTKIKTGGASATSIIKTVGKKDKTAVVEVAEKTEEIATLDEQEAEEKKIVEETGIEAKAEAVPEDPQEDEQEEEQKFDIKDAEAPQTQIVTFATSQLPIDSQLTAYLTELL